MGVVSPLTRLAYTAGRAVVLGLEAEGASLIAEHVDPAQARHADDVVAIVDEQGQVGIEPIGGIVAGPREGHLLPGIREQAAGASE